MNLPVWRNATWLAVILLFLGACKARTTSRAKRVPSPSAHLYGGGKKAPKAPARSKTSRRMAKAHVAATPASSSPPRTSRVAATDRARTVIETARSYYGVPYKYGGTTRVGMDCSALVCASYQSVDVALPRVSSQMSTVGKAVKENDLQPGDLLFFNTKRAGRINHVGIVTEIDGGTVRFIHASTSLGVVESNLNTDYYRRAFVKAMRPVE